ncbi:MAG: hypothetical protein Q8N18_17485 [Opitutaceae bacterium]|nr:hypothetical protein [Opitutaceae bacterium]
MPTLTARSQKPKSRTPRARAKHATKRGPAARSFAEGMRPFFGMVKNAPPDLSTREGFGR